MPIKQLDKVVSIVTFTSVLSFDRQNLFGTMYVYCGIGYFTEDVQEFKQFLWLIVVKCSFLHLILELIPARKRKKD